MIGPSNPLVSIGPILAVRGMREALLGASAPVVAVSPIVAGEVLKGPTAAFMRYAGRELSAAGIGAVYGELLDGIVTDEDAPPGLACLRTDTRMGDADARIRLAPDGTLDVYVGSLARYYAGEWENVAEKAARERGVQYQIGRPGGSTDRLKDPQRIPPAVLAWRSALSDSLGSKLALPLDWDEALEVPYFTGRPGWDGFGSLVLWAAYAEHPALRQPATNVGICTKQVGSPSRGKTRTLNSALPPTGQR